MIYNNDELRAVFLGKCCLLTQEYYETGYIPELVLDAMFEQSAAFLGIQ